MWKFPGKVSKSGRKASQIIFGNFRKEIAENFGILDGEVVFFSGNSRIVYSIHHKKFRKFKSELFHRIGTPVIFKISGKLDR